MPTLPTVTVFVNKYAKGWEGDQDSLPAHTRPNTKDCGQRSTLKQVLEWAQYTDDAHFATYWLGGPAETPRLKKHVEHPGHLHRLEQHGRAVKHDVLVFDVDDEEAKAEGRPCDPAWRDTFDRRMASIEGGTPWWYHTTHGTRVIYLLPEPLAPDAFEGYLRQAMKLFDNLSGYETDKACKDWSRLYRVPYAKRRGHRQDWPVHIRGDLPPKFLLDVAKAARNEVTAQEAIAAVFIGDGPFMLPDKISAGNRHGMMVSYAASLRARGLGESEIYPLLLIADKERCDPTIQDDPERGPQELQSIANHAASKSVADKYRELIEGKPPAETAPDESPEAAASVQASDLDYYTMRPAHVQTPTFISKSAHIDMAEWTLAVQEGTGPKMIYAEGSMWRYSAERGVWCPYDTSQLQQMARVANRGRVFNAEGEAVEFGLSDHGTKAIANQMRLGRCAGSLNKALFPPQAPPGIAFNNGYVTTNGNGAVVTTHDRQHNARVYVPVAYIPDAPTPVFDQFCKDIWPDDPKGLRKETVLRYLGLCLMGRATEAQVALLWCGEKARNGKSTFLKLIKLIFPRGTVTTLSRKDISATFVSAELQHSLINIAAELSSEAVVQDEKLKMSITGDEFTVQRKNQQPFSMKPRGGFIFAVNDVPWMDPSYSIMRRFIPIHYNRRLASSKIIDNFEEHMMGERAGILAACMRAAGRYFEARANNLPGFPLGDASGDPVILEADHVYEIFNTLKTADHKDGASITVIYGYYRNQCRERGLRRPLTRKLLANRLKKLGFTRKTVTIPSATTKSGATTSNNFNVKLPEDTLFANLH